MANEYDENYVGDLALKKQLITAQQLEECKKLKASSSPTVSLARVLLEKGYLGDTQLGEMLKEYRLTVGEMVPDESDPGSIQFGEAVVKKGLAKNVDIWDAIEVKSRKGEGAAQERLGQILVERGTLALTQAKEILESQGKRILKCAECGHQYNVREYNSNKEYTCLNCGGPLSVPDDVSSLIVQGTAVDSQTVKQSMDDRFVGTEIGGCEILQKLGEGGMGSVYKARHITLNKVVAVKVMSSALMGEIHRKRFLREARAAAQLEHTNIVAVHDTGVAEGFNYIVMQFIDGESIQRKISRDGKFGQKESLRVIRDAADALGFAHKRHMIHRDIKPDNIMLTSDNVVKVADFGLVKSTEIEKDLTGMSQSMLMGTPHYMSPEQFEGKIIDHRTDIYSLGVTIYYMLTGQRPYDGTTPYQIMQGHLQQEFVDPSNLSEDIYPAVSQFVRKMMARDREQRYQSCEEAIADIDKIMAGFEDGTIATGDFIIIEDDEIGPTIQATAPEVVGKKAAPTPPKKKKSALVIIIPAVVLVVVVAGLLAFLLLSGPKEKENGEGPVVVDPQPDPTDLKQAQLAFERTKMQSNKLADKDKFSEAMAKWKDFVPTWGKDPWQDKVDIERALILERALERIKEWVASGKKEDLQKALQEATAMKDLEPDEQFASVASEADQKLKAMESADETHKRKLAEFEEADKRAQELKKQDKLTDAKDVYKDFLTSDVSEIANKAQERVAEIDSILDQRKTEQERQWADYRTAQAEARGLLSKNHYKDARDRYIPFTGQKYLTEIRDDAAGEIEKIEAARKIYASEQFKAALKSAKDLRISGDYDKALEVIGSYVGDENPPEIKEPARELRDEIRSYKNFWSEMKRVDNLRNEGKYTQALEIARNYEKSENTSFATESKKKTKQIRKERFLEKDLIFIDGGKIPIGSNDARDRNPSRSVEIKPFYMDKTEVTNAQYEEFVRDKGYKAPRHWRGGRVPRGKGDHPVAWVTCKDALEYCKWRSKKERATYRLPTESEWEYAASYDPEKGEKSTYPWGNKFDSSYANLSGGKTVKAGANKSDISPLEVYDMAGNVAEWTTSDDGKYVVRGGSMFDENDPQAARVSFRHQTDPDMKGAGIGFRCVREK